MNYGKRTRLGWSWCLLVGLGTISCGDDGGQGGSTAGSSGAADEAGAGQGASAGSSTVAGESSIAGNDAIGGDDGEGGADPGRGGTEPLGGESPGSGGHNDQGGESPGSGGQNTQGGESPESGGNQGSGGESPGSGGNEPIAGEPGIGGGAGEGVGGQTAGGQAAVAGQSAGGASAGSGGELPTSEDCANLPLPVPSAATRTVSSAEELKAAVEGDADPGETIFIEDGTYRVEPMAVTVADITIRSSSGARDAVTLDLEYTPNDVDNGAIFNVWASGVTIAHLTLSRAYSHAVHVAGTENGDTTDILLYDLHIQNSREQQIKLNADGSGQYGPRRGRVACSLLELTEAGRAEVADYGGYTSCYTGGIDGHVAFDWVVENNVISGIYCQGREVDIAEHAVHFWSTSGNVLVQNNVIVDCSRGVGLGMGESTQPGSIVRNNRIFASDGFTGFDTGIELEGVSNVSVIHNTVVGAMLIGINQRRESDTGQIANNLLMGSARDLMGSSGCEASNNYTLTDLSLFASTEPRSSDFLRLTEPGSSSVVDAGLALGELCPDDMDGESRDDHPDIGADELSP